MSMFYKLAWTAFVLALVVPAAVVQAQQQQQQQVVSPAVKAGSRLERDALWNWLTYGRLGHYTPEMACRDAGPGAPESAMSSCVALVRTQAAMDQAAQATLKARRMQDDENAIRELVARAAAGDFGAEARCQWAIDGLQREATAWQACRARVREAIKSATAGLPADSPKKSPNP